MNATHRKHAFMSSQPHDTQSIAYSSNDDILLQPRTQSSQQSTTYFGVDHSEPIHGIDQPYSKPRRAPDRHFWRQPLGLGTVIFIGDVILTIAPCAFLTLAFQALTVSGKAVTSHGEKVEQASKLGPTVFPIIFAAVMGRLMRTWALWRAERGAPLGLLEQLSGSQNLLAAFERAVLLPGLGVLSFVVVLLWALSPLGGQSSLRILSRGDASIYNTSGIYYFNSTGDGSGGTFLGASALSSGGRTLTGIVQAALISIERVKGNDLWGNVKIPFLDQVPSYPAESDGNGWYGFSENNYSAPYSALTGVVVSGLQNGLDTNFSLESSYFNLTCLEPRFFATDYSENSTDYYGGLLDWAGTLLVHTNSSQLFIQVTTDSVEANSYFLDTNWNSTTASPDSKFNVIFASRGGQETEIAAYNCTMGITHVESDILCQGTVCQVQRLRLSRNVTWPSPASGWPFLSQSTSVPSNLLGWLSSATSISHSGMVSPIDWYVSGSDTPFQLDYASETDVSYHDVSGAKFATRLGSLINTAYQSALQMAATAQPPSDNETALVLSLNDTTYSDGVGYKTTYTSATTSLKEPRFIANKVWVTITLVIAFILLFCGILSIIFKYGTRSPDILGYVSSMTRDNPNFEHLPGGDKLDGLQRARALRHVRVQIADVRPWDDEGHITLRNLGHGKT